MLHFCAAILLSGHGFEVNWICHCGGDCSRRLWWGGGGWAGQKIGNNIFQAGQIQHLHIEFGINVSQIALLLWRMVAEMLDNAVTSGLWSVHN